MLKTFQLMVTTTSPDTVHFNVMYDVVSLSSQGAGSKVVPPIVIEDIVAVPYFCPSVLRSVRIYSPSVTVHDSLYVSVAAPNLKSS